MTLYTIGYQSLSVKDVLVVLADNRIRRRIDVHRLALSRKRGFSQAALF